MVFKVATEVYLALPPVFYSRIILVTK